MIDRNEAGRLASCRSLPLVRTFLRQLAFQRSFEYRGCLRKLLCEQKVDAPTSGQSPKPFQAASGSSSRKGVEVQVLSSAPIKSIS